MKAKNDECHLTFSSLEEDPPIQMKEPAINCLSKLTDRKPQKNLTDNSMHLQE